MPQTYEHTLIFNAVIAVLNTSIPGLSQLTKTAIAVSVAVNLRDKVRIKERDE